MLLWLSAPLGRRSLASGFLLRRHSSSNNTSTAVTQRRKKSLLVDGNNLLHHFYNPLTVAADGRCVLCALGSLSLSHSLACHHKHLY